MRKITLLAALVATVFPALASVTVEGKAPLSLGQESAREAAISQALLDASYRNNAYVSGVTKIRDLAVEESRALIKTSSLIEAYKIVDENTCGDFYCVMLDVTYGEKLQPVDDLKKSFIVEVFSENGSVSIDEMPILNTIERSLRAELNGFNGMYEVESNEEADYKISVVVAVKDVDKNFINRWFTEKKSLSGFVVVNTRGDELTKEFVGSTNVATDEFEGSDELYELAAQLKAISYDAIKSMPLENNYVVGNIEGRSLFVKSNTLDVGDVFEVVFEDLKTTTPVKIVGYVESVFKGDVLIKLQEAPLPSYRLRRLTKIAE